jgi:hypothetical protein
MRTIHEIHLQPTTSNPTHFYWTPPPPTPPTLRSSCTTHISQPQLFSDQQAHYNSPTGTLNTFDAGQLRLQQFYGFISSLSTSPNQQTDGQYVWCGTIFGSSFFENHNLPFTIHLLRASLLPQENHRILHPAHHHHNSLSDDSTSTAHPSHKNFDRSASTTALRTPTVRKSTPSLWFTPPAWTSFHLLNWASTV